MVNITILTPIVNFKLIHKDALFFEEYKEAYEWYQSQRVAHEFRTIKVTREIAREAFGFIIK